MNLYRLGVRIFKYRMIFFYVQRASYNNQDVVTQTTQRPNRNTKEHLFEVGSS